MTFRRSSLLGLLFYLYNISGSKSKYYSRTLFLGNFMCLLGLIAHLGKGPKIKKRESMVFDHPPPSFSPTYSPYPHYIGSPICNFSMNYDY